VASSPRCSLRLLAVHRSGGGNAAEPTEPQHRLDPPDPAAFLGHDSDAIEWMAATISRGTPVEITG
jgi:hypothetical protein